MPRTRHVWLAGIAAATLAAASASLPRGGAAQAAPEAGAIGTWNRDDGRGGIRIFACGNALCGTVVWLRDKAGPAHIGQRVLYDMKQTAANEWSGSAHNPEDGRDYAGTMTVAGDRLLTSGCVFGGLICQSVGLTRAR